VATGALISLNHASRNSTQASLSKNAESNVHLARHASEDFLIESEFSPAHPPTHPQRICSRTLLGEDCRNDQLSLKDPLT